MHLSAAGKQRVYFFGNKITRPKVHSIFGARHITPIHANGKASPASREEQTH